ncbi:MAG: tryptophan synthase subunit alpha [Buchnera aphidicola (Chaetogeoica yunlongensis)]
MINRYCKVNNQLILEKSRFFIPFLVLGDPSIEISFKIIHTLIKNGADGLELGIPFSDPLADGPTIQKANLRAFKANINIHKCFNMLSKLRNIYPKLPIGILIYANLIFRYGIENFYKKCKKIDIDSVLIADLPIEESLIFRTHAKRNDINPVFICPPNANKILLKKISVYNTAYIYLLSRPGVTGINKFNIFLLQDLILKLKKLTLFPIIQGFGITNAQQIKNIVLSGASGVICGSVIIDTIENNLYDYQIMLNQLKKLSKTLKQATTILT